MSVVEEKKQKPYWSDPIMEEIYQMREEHAKSFNYDTQAMFEELYIYQKKLAKQGIQFVNKPLKKLGED
jgi:hypothetical protein